jgi:glycosyltransferase involved in cell wall biosynthesis
MRVTDKRRPPSDEPPYFSICIPQFNRTSFLIEACKSLQYQTFRDFEVCISDDCSTDGRSGELLEFLDRSDLEFAYRQQASNARYDANLRSAIACARGQFVFLLGNDDRLASPTVLGDLHASLGQHPNARVVVTNYADCRSGQRFARVNSSGIVGSGPGVALSTFRNFSFVSGLVFRTADAQQHATSRWDGSEMYQMYLGSRIVATGGVLLHIDRISVFKDIFIAGETVDSYAAQPRLDPCPIVERELPLVHIGRLVADAVVPYEHTEGRARSVERIFRQLYAFTFPFWVVEYRRVQSARYALGVCLGLRPARSLGDLDLPPAARLRLNLLFWLSSLAALVVPVPLVNAMHGVLYRAAKAVH